MPSPVLFHLSKPTYISVSSEHFVGSCCVLLLYYQLVTTASATAVHVTFISNKSAPHMEGTIGVTKGAKHHFLRAPKQHLVRSLMVLVRTSGLFLHDLD